MLELLNILLILVMGSSNHVQTILMWSLFVIFSLTLYMFFSNFTFSFLYVEAALIKCFGLLLLSYKVLKTESTQGISQKTISLYALTFLSRLFSILRFPHYLPADNTGDFIYKMIEACSFLLCIFLMMRDYDVSLDLFGNIFVPNKFGIVYLIIPCLLLALFIHPSLNHEFFSDCCWSFSMYLDGISMLPQIYMLFLQAKNRINTSDVSTIS